MQVIIISSNSKTHKHWHLTRSKLLVLAAVLVSLVSISSYSFANWMHNNANPAQFKPTPPLSSSSTFTPSDNVQVSEYDATVTDFYARQLGGLQAETIRLRMFSERLAEIAGFDSAAFSLDEHPALGGIDQDGMPLSSEALDRGIQSLSDELRTQEEALAALEQYLLTEDTIAASIPTGKPVEDGWVSSFYGYRIDPFNGKKTFHDGLDIAAKSGSDVMAVADGIVTWVGERGGYGGLVEVDHGNGYVTRYAHNKTIKVKKGDRVSKGETLALMGSTGRSTGPHVHFEVLRDGQHVNPYNFIK
ncbi:M23 family metallopeptidase [Methylophaga sp. OBS1]|uniref:M23 family metallopeptidase n=1 Tax=Methylophaga sp. OBS1 TaxID=2991933 RepID=UPI00224F7D6F|nr:M23 family metallopeptidase [Methylophaga sp. OBS1]MCX4193436.1 M23 family metallopeptidase [Methylophaga sp. OBS1]